MLKHFLLAIIIATVSILSRAEDPSTTVSNSSSEQTNLVIPLGFSFKLVPALYWGTVGAQVEYPVSEKFSACVMVMSKLAESRGYSVKKEDFHENGFSIDLIGKYFIKGAAPEGFYGLVNLSYNTMLYFDGSTRPYTMHNRWKEFNGYRVPNDLVKPKPFNASVGAGYQLIVIPQHIIADVFIGVSGSIDHDNTPFVQFYMTPSLGYVF